MKKIFLILFFGLFINQNFAQNNLQLNQVINLEFVSTGTTVTVPTGKIWKIENCLLTSINNYACMVYNGSTYYLRQHNTSSSSWDNFPFWIGEGKTITLGGNCSSGMLSILEFNLVP